MSTRDAVAIVGMGCRFPGGGSDPASLWRLLVECRDAINEIPRDRIDLGHYYDARPATPGRIMTRWGGFLPRIDGFDAAFFGMSPREAERLDPQQRLLLETAWEALEDAGQNVSALDGSVTGVFVGQWLSDFEARLFADPEAVDFYMTTGSGRYASSGRLSYLLGLRGPSLTIDTACSSSLVAVHMAAQSIRNGESTLALAGGVNVILQPHISVAYSQSRMMAPDGRCKFGDASGDGYVRSEGAGLIVLKPLAAARADGDRIYAVIHGSAVNNDGRSSGSMGTPSRVGQQELLRAAYRDARVPVTDVGYVEAHGTGTRAGDPVELGALNAVLAEGRAPGGSRVRVGSVKTNFGHTEGAAGIAGLMKAALCLYHEAVPASLHCKTLNPVVPWAESCVEVARAASPWLASADGGAAPAGAADAARVDRRVAGVSAFGIAGTNAHVVLGGARGLSGTASTDARADSVAGRAYVLPLSARSPEALKELASAYAALLEAPAAPSLSDLCANAALYRTPLEHRAVFACETAADLLERLRRFVAGEKDAAQAVGEVAGAPGAARGAAAAGGGTQAGAAGGAVRTGRRVAFIFPGQGSQWVGMARELSLREPVFAAALDRCETAMRPFVDWSLREQLAAAEKSTGWRMDDIAVIQPVLLAVEIALGELWRSLGVEPEAVVGHSMGEAGAAYFAGALSLEDAMAVICTRSALMRRTSGRGAMAVVELSFDELSARLQPVASKVTVAVSNAPRSSVMSGDPAVVAEQLAQLEREGIFARPVKVDVASHSPQMDPLVPELLSTLARVSPKATTVSLYSTVLADKVSGAELNADYWGRNLRRPVMFGATIAKMLAAGIDTFIELSPHPLLLGAVSQVSQASQKPAVALQSTRRQEPEQQTLLASFGALFVAGHPVQWSRVCGAVGARRIDLPKYPWQRERFWVRQALQGAAGGGAGAKAPELSDKHRPWLHSLRWQPMEASSRQVAPVSTRPWVLIAADASLAGVVSNALRNRGHQAVVVDSASLAKTLDSLRATPPQGVVLLAPEGLDAAFAPVATLQACSRVFGKLPDAEQPKLWLVTRGAQVVEQHPRTAPVAVEQAAGWGAGRVVAEDHPTVWGGMIDLDPDAEPAALSRGAGELVDELLGPDGEDQIAWRAGSRYVPRVGELEEFEVAPRAWRADGAYLITGGLGGIGSLVATSMVERGARRLVLLNRTALPPRASWSGVAADSPTGRRIATVRALEKAGASVHLLVADMSDAADVERALESYESEAWPPIVGVVHAAGLLGSKLTLQMDRASFDRVLLPKLAGAMHLDRLLPNVDVFILFGSTSALLGLSGMSNYAAGNAGLDALAAARRARGAHALNIQWGPWLSTGMQAGEVAERSTAELDRQGVQPLPAADGVALYEWLVGFPGSSVIAMPVDWAKFGSSRGGRNRRIFMNRIGDAGSADSAAGDFAARLAAAESPHARRQMLESTVRDTAAQVLHVSPRKLDTRRPLGTMGLDSLMAIELRNRLEALLGRPLSATLAWNYPTVEALATFLSGDDFVTQAAAPAAPQPSESESQSLEAGLEEILALSDEDIARELRGGSGS